MVQCWLLSEEAATADPRGECHKTPKEFLPIAHLARIGVFYQEIPIDDTKEGLGALAKERGYAHRDEVIVSRAQLPQYEQKLKSFFEEHLHTDEEVRYILAGEGYFDVRDEKDRWIRIHVERGDLLVIPPGIYHRFIPTIKDFTHAVRLFKEAPAWTPYNRSLEADRMPVRIDYMKSIHNSCA